MNGFTTSTADEETICMSGSFSVEACCGEISTFFAVIVGGVVTILSGFGGGGGAIAIMKVCGRLNFV